MMKISIFTILIFFTVSIFAARNVEGSKPVLQKTVEALFSDRSDDMYPSPCKIIVSSNRQSKMCKKEAGLYKILSIAKQQAITACEEQFKYDRWNCSLVFNKKAKRKIFNKIYRENAFIHALIGASLTHAIARGCASGELSRCSCISPMSYGNKDNVSWQMNGGCGDDFKYGKRYAKNFIDWKLAGADQIAEALKQDVSIGIDSVGVQLKEVCKCHGFSGSCTTKTCWKRLGPFNSAMGLLKKHYHHAIKRRIFNFTSKRAITPKVRRKLEKDKANLVYFQKTPNLCAGTRGRICRDRPNCATLCCGRGYKVAKKSVSSRCRCEMVDCCFVKCDTCVEEVDYFICK